MYIDPSAGSLVLQAAAAAALSGLALFSRARTGLKVMLASLFARRKAD